MSPANKARRQKAAARRRPPSEPLETGLPVVVLGPGGDYARGYYLRVRVPGVIASRASGLPSRSSGARVLSGDSPLPRGDHDALSGAEVMSRPDRVFLWIVGAAFAWLVAGVTVWRLV